MLAIETKPGSADVDLKIRVDRAAYTRNTLVKAYGLQWEDDPTIKDKAKVCIGRQLHCSSGCWKDRLLRFFPFISILRTYRWREWLLLDLLSGLSVGVIHIPQGMGFSLLTSLPAVYGLYSSFFPVLIYYFFGTSRHISMGTMALISLMIGRVVIREVDKMAIPTQYGNGTDLENGTAAIQEQIDQVRIETAVSVSLLIGCIQFAMGFLGLGAIATFMSMPFIGSFLCAAALHIITSQAPSVFGLTIHKYSGMFRIPLTYYDVCRHLAETNVCTVVTAILALAVLVVLKNVINERYGSRMIAPIPAELIVVTASTLICHYCGLHAKYGMKIVGPIPAGLPRPTMPPMRNAVTYIGDSVVAAVVSFVISVSMAKLMAKKHGYAIDVNQELYAYGLSHAGSSFFSSFAGAQAPPRTLVHESIGGRTQLASLFSCLMLLLVCLFLGKLFYSLPIPVLAAVIIVALLPMFKQFQQLPTLWRVNKYDLFVWIITFLSAVILDITSGLIIGIASSIFFVVFQAHFASGTTLVSLDDSDIFLTKDRLQSDRIIEYPGIQVFRFDAPLFFVNIEKFKTQLFRKISDVQQIIEEFDSDMIAMVTVDPDMNGLANNLLEKHAGPSDPLTGDNCSRRSGSRRSLDSMEASPSKNTIPDMRDDAKIHAVILDCSAISYVDIMGTNMLKAVSSDLDKMDISMSLACVHDSVANKLEAAGAVCFADDERTSSSAKFIIYPTVKDAVVIESKRRKSPL
ncbi:hypothetical protein LSH36_51g01015 [Paralvinella palmiformis]|uniref:STAS domain-containing protein n=1 Tax=Paralvinella palmiformis TaxID=53620 RepID=A0AAD9K6C7_9ANNE|nr:hypothetical protein LSH36_51g01015 [Paralvinella palmiformis]